MVARETDVVDGRREVHRDGSRHVAGTIPASLDGSRLLFVEGEPVVVSPEILDPALEILPRVTGGVLQDETRFGCVLGVFKLSDGIVQSDTLFAESDHLIANGKVRIDLDSKEINLSITPRSKKRAFQIPGTIRVTGSLDNPKFSTSAIATSVDTAAQVVMIAPSIAMRAFDTTLSLLGAAPKETEQALSPCQQAQQN